MFLKWLFDKLASLFGLLFLSPVLLVVAILIKVKMPGPVLFCQKRVGQYGKLFTVYKFRSMTVKAEASVASRDSDATSIASTEQNRITPLGEKLRRYKLDELPELWNVLKGDMSFVGPRPDVPGYADQLQGEDRDILKLKPGITGPASLKYRNEEELLASVDNPARYNDEVIFPDKVKLNLYYLKHYSFIKDIQMIICTVLGKKMDYADEII
ncbi:sugar transferase [Prevotella pallens]|uniref:sugar transferase n=1 Tax=Prevotella pallens TaxID=60133 RepID=UPI001CADAB5A|nr:sugar transferase [Prevotella pallens]MBF1482826.1 sugar transferase [Prevotella pallens]